MKFRKYASKKVIAIMLAGLLVLGSMFNQNRKIQQLQKDLYIQQNLNENKYSYTETTLLKDTIQEELNSLCEFKVLSGTVNIKHTYNYERESILGLNSKYTLAGTADYYYSYVVNLSDAKVIKATDNKVIIKLSKPYLDESSCHRVPNTFYKIEEECSNNLLSNKTDAEKTTRAWEDTFDSKGQLYIKDYYTNYNNQNKLNNTTIHQIKLLLEELGYSQSLEIKF